MNKIMFAVIVATLLNICWSRAEIYRPVRMSSRCKGQTYCLIKGPLYPEDKVKAALNNSQVQKIRPLENWCAGRSEDPAEEMECGKGSCGARIYYIKDLNDNTRVVLQSDERNSEFKQLYDITQCQTEGVVTRTDHLTKRSLQGHTMTCETTYSEYYFHVLNLKGDGVEFIRGKLPVCCQCTLKKK